MDAATNEATAARAKAAPAARQRCPTTRMIPMNASGRSTKTWTRSETDQRCWTGDGSMRTLAKPSPPKANRQLSTWAAAATTSPRNPGPAPTRSATCSATTAASTNASSGNRRRARRSQNRPTDTRPSCDHSARSRVVTRKPESVKKLEMPRKPPLTRSYPWWKARIASSANARSPSKPATCGSRGPRSTVPGAGRSRRRGVARRGRLSWPSPSGARRGAGSVGAVRSPRPSSAQSSTRPAGGSSPMEGAVGEATVWSPAGACGARSCVASSQPSGGRAIAGSAHSTGCRGSPGVGSLQSWGMGRGSSHERRGAGAAGFAARPEAPRCAGTVPPRGSALPFGGRPLPAMPAARSASRCRRTGGAGPERRGWRPQPPRPPPKVEGRCRRRDGRL